LGLATTDRRSIARKIQYFTAIFLIVSTSIDLNCITDNMGSRTIHPPDSLPPDGLPLDNSPLG